MAWIVRRQTKRTSSGSGAVQMDESRRQRQLFYASTAWRKLRSAYLLAHPICELCKAVGVVRPAIDIHHIHSPFTEDFRFALDPANLLSVCKTCHAEIHKSTDLRIKLYSIYEDRVRQA